MLDVLFRRLPRGILEGVEVRMQLVRGGTWLRVGRTKVEIIPTADGRKVSIAIQSDCDLDLEKREIGEVFEDFKVFRGHERQEARMWKWKIDLARPRSKSFERCFAFLGGEQRGSMWSSRR